ncbi:hypothetical protein [Acinetobacter vivianii]|uniref:hypothetical protein n=1 Tax=Acinetobacter vivianii TaxID=1776742 RepID=UPI003D003CAE
MKKLSKKEYNKIVKQNILNTGLYNGRHVDEGDYDDELYEHLQEISQDHEKGVLTAFNADAEIAFNYFRNEESDNNNLDFDFHIDYGSHEENMNDINTHFGKF